MNVLSVDRKILIAFLIGSVLFNMSIFSAPFLLYLGHTDLASWNYQFFSPICHQVPSRSFAAWGHPLGVCARCAGIYAGFLAGILFLSLTLKRPLRQVPKRKYFFLFLTPTLLDFVLNVTGILSSPCILRAFTGFVLGMILPLYIMPGICEMRAQGSWKRPLSMLNHK